MKIAKRRFNNIPTEISQKIAAKNRLRGEWQLTYYGPAKKYAMNKNTSFIKVIIKTHNQDEWDKFLSLLSIHDGSAYKLLRFLLNKSQVNHIFFDPNGLLFSANDKADVFTDTFQEQFSPNHGDPLIEVKISILSINYFL